MTEDLNLSDLGRNPAQITLADATFAEITDELDRRYTATVVLVVETLDDDEVLSTHFDGGAYAAIGMAESFAYTLKHKRVCE